MTTLDASAKSQQLKNEPSSWADMVKQVDRERKTLPWDSNSTQPVERVSLYHVSLNPVHVSEFTNFCVEKTC
jgi:hypothetical protein